MYDIIDFHTHPFTNDANNICGHKEYCNMSVDNTMLYMREIGVTKICGSVICRKTHGSYKDDWEAIADSNACALELKKHYNDFYIPGFHVHPGYIKQSCEEIEKMNRLGIRLIGELVPYLHGWTDYSCHGFDEILDFAQQKDMVVSFHSMGEDEMDAMVKKHPNVTFIAAHPGEYENFTRHMERMKMSDNYYLDLSGTGIFRHGMLRHAIDVFGAEKFIFGSDYPTCSPAMFIGAVLLDNMITDSEKEMIFSKNIKRLLNL